MPSSLPAASPESRQQIAVARAELAGAEQDLEHALQAVPSAARAEKRIISAALVAAMEKRSAAKGRLESALAAAGQIS